MGAPILQYEAAQAPAGYVLLADSGDRTIFNLTGIPLVSKVDTPVVRPNGLISGGAITPAASSTNNYIDVAALTCYLAGVLTTVGADADVDCARPTVSNCCVYSITVTSAGAIAAVKGTEGGAIVSTRDAAGGPPLIAVGSIEIGQVHYTSQSAADVLASEIHQVPGTHQERSASPTWDMETYRVADGVLGVAGVTFHSALPSIHTGSVAKRVYLSYSAPSFANVAVAKDFKRPADSKSVSSEEYYGLTKGKTSTSLGQGSFTAALESLSDPLLSHEGEFCFFKFFPDREDTDKYVLAQGYLGVDETYEIDGQISAACTISAQYAGKRITG
jgi:hypothetical protein